MLTRIYVNKQRLRAGQPAIAVRTYKGVRYAREVVVGEVVVRQRPCPGLPVTKCYIETRQKVKVKP